MVEIIDLLRVVDRELSDAQVAGLSTDGQFEHAYEAALQSCVIALHASGYRVRKGQGLHKRAIDSLRLTLGDVWADDADFLERCSRMRGQAVYDRVGVATDEDVADLIELAKKLRAALLAWLKTDHAHLIPPNQT